MHTLPAAAIAAIDTVRREIDAFITLAGADELMLVGPIFAHQKRLRSSEITAQLTQ